MERTRRRSPQGLHIPGADAKADVSDVSPGAKRLLEDQNAARIHYCQSKDLFSPLLPFIGGINMGNFLSCACLEPTAGVISSVQVGSTLYTCDGYNFAQGGLGGPSPGGATDPLVTLIVFEDQPQYQVSFTRFTSTPRFPSGSDDYTALNLPCGATGALVTITGQSGTPVEPARGGLAEQVSAVLAAPAQDSCFAVGISSGGAGLNGLNGGNLASVGYDNAEPLLIISGGGGAASYDGTIDGGNAGTSATGFAGSAGSPAGSGGNGGVPNAGPGTTSPCRAGGPSATGSGYATSQRRLQRRSLTPF